MDQEARCVRLRIVAAIAVAQLEAMRVANFDRHVRDEAAAYGEASFREVEAKLKRELTAFDAAERGEG